MHEQIKNYLLQKIGEGVTLNNADNFFEKGVNSMFALQLIMYLEKTFDIRIENQDLNIENFNSVDNIVRFVEEKQKGKSVK